MITPFPLNEVERLHTLHKYKILDTPPEAAFDHVTDLAARYFRVPFALVTLIGAERQWFKSCFGTEVRDVPRELSFCTHTILSNQVMAVPNALLDPRFQDNPFVSGETQVRSYAGAPLKAPGGYNLGTLCIIDTKPRCFSGEQQEMLAGFATIVMDEMELRLTAHVHQDSELERKRDLASSQIEILQRLARAAEYRDDDTGKHTYRVANTAALLGEALGLPEEQVELIKQAAPLHDVGKIAISDLLLLKPGKLTNEEFAIMKTHAATGARLLSEGRSAVVQMSERIAGTHHERWDGRGYPVGLVGEQIPLEGRIVAIADVFDALTHDRPYKKAWPAEEAVAEIVHQSGKQFDPQIVKAFLTLSHNALI